MRSPVVSPAMIGRAADLDALRQELELSIAGSPRGVVIGGEAGIGKTRLLDEFRAEAAGRAHVLVGRCVDLGADSAPYAPITTILRALAVVLTGENAPEGATVAREVTATATDGGVGGGVEVRDGGFARLLEAAGPGRDALAVLLPELAASNASDPRIGAERLYEVVAVLLENASARHPLVVMVEDVHWADAATLDLLRFLLQMLESGRVLIVLSYRSDEILRGHRLRRYLPELERSRSVVRWELGRLNREQVAAQVRAILGHRPDDVVVDRVYERSEGVPFFVEELLGIGTGAAEGEPGGQPGDGGGGGVNTGGAHELPETLRELLLARYERLSDDAQGVLRLLSVGGVCVDHVLLEAVYDGDVERLDAAAREAVFANVLTVDEHEYSFRHALVREAVLADLLPGERTRFHRRYAAAFESGVSGTSAASEASFHWMAASDPGKAFPATLDAMAEARTAYAYGAAARLGERALELWDHVPDAARLSGRSHGELLAETAYVLRNAGDSERAIVLVNAALEECPSDDRHRRASLLREKASYMANLGRLGATQMMRDAAALLDGEPPSELRAMITGELAARLMLEARYDEAIDAATFAFDEAQAVGSRVRMSVSSNLRGVSRVGHGDIEAGLADMERAREYADGEDSAMLRYRVNASDIMNLLGRYGEAISIAETGIRRAEELGVKRTSGIMLASNTIEPLLAAGDWARADELLDRALALAPPPAFRVQLQRLKLWSTLWGGDVAGAATLLRRWRPATAVLEDFEMQSRVGIACVAAEIALAEGDPERAWGEAGVILTEAHRPMPAYDLRLLVVAAQAVAGLRAAGATRARVEHGGPPGSGGKPVMGIAAIESALRERMARLTAWPTFFVWAAIFEAELSGPRGDGTDSEAWQRAVEATGSDVAPAHLRPYSLYRLARAEAALGDRRAAQTAVAEAERLASGIGAGLVVRWADSLAERAGLRGGVDGAVGTRARSAPADAIGLTAREAQVLELLGKGLSNRQIGEQLFISAKTASVHVSAILKKVGASTRTEASYLARRQG